MNKVVRIISLSQEQQTRVKAWATEQLFYGTVRGRVVDPQKIKVLTQEQRAVVLAAFEKSPDPTHTPEITGDIDDLIEALPEGSVSHEKKPLQSMMKRIRKVSGRHIEVETVIEAVESKKNELLPTHEDKVFERLGVIREEVADIVKKVLEGEKLEETEQKKLKEHHFVLLKNTNEETIGIANRAQFVAQGGFKVIFKAFNLAQKVDAVYAEKFEEKDDASYQDEVKKELAFADAFRDTDDASLFVLSHKVTVVRNDQVTYSTLMMPFAKGGSLKQRLNSDPPTPQQMVNYTLDLLKAVKVMHENGWTHRDIKPDNLLLDGNEHLKVSDFGLSVNKTEGVESAGTAGYLDPEIFFRPDKAKTQKIDCFSVGVTIYEMMYPKHPLPRVDLKSKSQEAKDNYLDEVIKICDGLDRNINRLERKIKGLEGKREKGDQLKVLNAQLALNKALRGLLAANSDKRMNASDALELLENQEGLEEVFEMVRRGKYVGVKKAYQYDSYY